MIGEPILTGVGILLNAYYYAMIYYIISSWVPMLRANFVGAFVEKIVEPYLGIFRKIIPPLGMIDISPIFGFIAYNFIQRYLFEGVRFLLQAMNLL